MSQPSPGVPSRLRAARRRDPGRAVALGCGALFAVFLVLTVLGACVGSRQPTRSAGGLNAPAGQPGPRPVAEPPAGPTLPALAGTADAAARATCRMSVQAAAYRAAGHAGRAAELDAAAVSELHGSTVPAAPELGAGPDPARDVRAWCRATLPQIKATPIPRKAARPPRPQP